MTKQAVLGLSAYYHDAAAALLVDGVLVAAAQEERFSRIKHDARFPRHAVRYCLDQAGLRLADVDRVVFYEKPLVKLERLMETYLALVPRGATSFLRAIPEWLKKKLWFRRELERELSEATGEPVLRELLFTEHHQAHAAAAFFPSPFERAGVLCLDGVGEWATTSVWLGEGNRIEPRWELRFPHSLGLLYSAFTYHLGFKVDSGEYKVMGLAPHGTPKYAPLILEHLVDLKEDGTFRLDLSYFDFATGLTMTNGRFEALLGRRRRAPESALAQDDMDVARSIQVVTEEIVLRLARTVHRELGVDRLCLAGGVALNCVANGRVAREGPFESVWVQPAAGDAGGAVGAAFAVWHESLGMPRAAPRDAMHGARLGPKYSADDICRCLDSHGMRYERWGEAELSSRIALAIADGNVVGWFQGRMEFGPRALGSRSILADPRDPEMTRILNEKVKRREAFRPFAPAIKAEAASKWFELTLPSPYMQFTVPARTEVEPRLSATTHVDGSARVQTVTRDVDPRFWSLLDAFEQLTGCPALVNTSFNVRGEPIVCTPEDALACFLDSGIDILVLDDIVLRRVEQPDTAMVPRRQYELD